MNKLKNLKLFNFLMLTIAGIINAIGVTIFLFPVSLYDGGISGLSMFLEQITPEYLTLSIFLVILNIPIFLYGLKKQGVVFTIYSIYAVLIYSLFAFLIKEVFPIDLSSSPIAGSDLLLCSIFGGVISGMGSGLVIRFGGAIDGIEVISVIFAKKLGISIGTFVLLFNLVLYIICGITFMSWSLPLYSIIAYFLGSKTVDFIVDGIDRSKCAMIVTTKANEINIKLSEEFESSGTVIDAIGGYSREKKQVVYFILNHFQINKLRTIVHEIDENAYIALSDVSDIIKAK